MIIGIVAIAMVLGTAASLATLATGGSLLFALAMYSSIGILAALAALAFAMLAAAENAAETDWSDCEPEGRQASV